MDGGESQILGLDAGGRFAVSEKRRGLVLVNRSVADVVANERYFFVVFSGVFVVVVLWRGGLSYVMVGVARACCIRIPASIM